MAYSIFLIDDEPEYIMDELGKIIKTINNLFNKNIWFISQLVGEKKESIMN